MTSQKDTNIFSALVSSSSIKRSQHKGMPCRLMQTLSSDVGAARWESDVKLYANDDDLEFLKSTEKKRAVEELQEESKAKKAKLSDLMDETTADLGKVHAKHSGVFVRCQLIDTTVSAIKKLERDRKKVEALRKVNQTVEGMIANYDQSKDKAILKSNIMALLAKVAVEKAPEPEEF